MRIGLHHRWGKIMSAVLLATATFAASAAQARLVAELAEEDGASLEPGQYLWLEDQDGARVGGTVSVVVSIASQRAYVYRDSRLIGLSTVSTGAPGHDTPVGAYPILQKKVAHRSNLYNDAPMPYMQRLTWDGVALHAGRIPGYPASHGCVRLPRAFAQTLFRATSIDSLVTITDGDVVAPPAPVAAPLETAESAPPADIVPVAAMSAPADAAIKLGEAIPIGRPR